MGISKTHISSQATHEASLNAIVVGAQNILGAESPLAFLGFDPVAIIYWQ